MMSFYSFLLTACTVSLFLICNSHVDANPQSASSSGTSQSMLFLAQSENQFHTQAKTIARGTHASLQIITSGLKLLENLSLWKMSTLGANATSTVANQMNVITGIGTIPAHGIIQEQCIDSVYYTQRSMALLRVPKTSILVSKDATKQLKLLKHQHQQKEEERRYSKCRLL